MKPGTYLKKSKSSLLKIARKHFNAWIRRRDSSEGVFRCISCNKTKPTTKMHAGHFYSAGKNKSLEFNEKNVNGQCSYCNTFEHGNLLGYREGLIKKYGPGIIDELGTKRMGKAPDKLELVGLILMYR